MKTDGDDLAWKREFEHVEAKQKQREGRDGKTYDIQETQDKEKPRSTVN